MKKIILKSKGFTLIELLVVIAIIALLTGILMVNFQPAKAKARDSKRVSDIGQIGIALELYYDRCKQYPSTISGDITTVNNGCETTNPPVSLSTYISQIPTPPSTGEIYAYAVDNSVGTYVLHTTLEIATDKPQDSLNQNHPLGISCGVTTDYCIGPK